MRDERVEVRQKDSVVLQTLQSKEYDGVCCIDFLVYAGQYVVFQYKIIFCEMGEMKTNTP